MKNIVKVGYILIGIGIGVLVSSIAYARELDKPIGEIEEYIPLEDRNDDISTNSETNEANPEDSSSSERSDISQKELDRLEKIRRYREITEGRSRRDNRSSRDRSSNYGEFNSNQSDVLDFYHNPTRHTEGQIDEKSFEGYGKKSQRAENEKTKGRRYSQMYKDSMTDAREYREPVDSSAISDHPYEDAYDECELEINLHKLYNLESLEPGFEVFLDDNPQDFVTVIFYEGDTTLCDDGEQIIPNPEEVVGFAALERLIHGGPGAENNVIFVHNMKTHINYEVVLDAGMYQDTVLGLFESRLDEEADEGGLGR